MRHRRGGREPVSPESCYRSGSTDPGPDGIHRLAPAYDQVSTRLVIEDDDLALPVGGKKSRLTRATWLELAGHSGIPARAAERVLGEIARRKEEAIALIGRSYLGKEMRDAYRGIIEERTASLSGPVA